MQKPIVIDLSYIEDYSITESTKDLIEITIKSEKPNRYYGIIKRKKIIMLKGAGDRYNGDYYIDKVTHSVRNDRYKTIFTLKKLY